MSKQCILLEFYTLLKVYKDNDLALNKAVYSFFKIQLDKKNTHDFYDAIIDDEQLAYYAAESYLQMVWDDVLLLTPLCKDINDECIYFRHQARVSSFHIIIGSYIFSKVDIDNLQSTVSQRYLSLGMKYNSIHCIDFYLRYLLDQYRSFDYYTRIVKSEYINQIMLIAGSQGVKHLTVGYIIFAKYCWKLFCINHHSNLKVSGLAALYLAKKLEAQSINEMHNAYSGKSFDINGLKTIDALIHQFSQKIKVNFCDDEKARELSEQLSRTIGMR